MLYHKLWIMDGFINTLCPGQINKWIQPNMWNSSVCLQYFFPRKTFLHVNKRKTAVKTFPTLSLQKERAEIVRREGRGGIRSKPAQQVRAAVSFWVLWTTTFGNTRWHGQWMMGVVIAWHLKGSSPRLLLGKLPWKRNQRFSAPKLERKNKWGPDWRGALVLPPADVS